MVLSRQRWTGPLCPRRVVGLISTCPTSLTGVSCPLNLSVRAMGLAGRQPFTSLSPPLFANWRSSAVSTPRGPPANLVSANTTPQTKSSFPSSRRLRWRLRRWRPKLAVMESRETRWV
ncbi:hypothetical protein B0T14DRAFT_550297 [Immersiella caudata]|uniref:Uncharacterized protein n=1 Tax=Immersiella caudata TaxID=314043 RepID=A0AA40CC28_9PEZI|nr:hypothetical protein B0T14DRAFT_550297 [Immersiella caudata]